MAAGLATLGVFCFSEAALGIDDKYIPDICYNIACLTPTIYLLVQGGAVAASMPLAQVAVMAVVCDQMETLGYIATVGLDS